MTDLKWSQYDFTKIPFDNIVKVGQRTMLHRDLFTVSWLLGRFCNYSCSYCWPYASSRVKDHRPIDLILMTIDEIKRQSRDNGYNSFHAFVFFLIHMSCMLPLGATNIGYTCSFGSTFTSTKTNLSFIANALSKVFRS